MENLICQYPVFRWKINNGDLSVKDARTVGTTARTEDPSGHDGVPGFLYPWSYDTVTIGLSGLLKPFVGIEFTFSISIDMKSIRESYSEGGVFGAMSTIDNSTYSANVSGDFSVGIALEAVGVISVTGSDGNLDDQNGVQIIGTNGYPLNYGVVIPPDGAGGIFAKGTTTLQPDSKNGLASSQCWGLGGGAGYGELGLSIISGRDSFCSTNKTKTQWKIPFANDSFMSKANQAFERFGSLLNSTFSK
jgi:hypothetical protein